MLSIGDPLTPKKWNWIDWTPTEIHLFQVFVSGELTVIIVVDIILEGRIRCVGHPGRSRKRGTGLASEGGIMHRGWRIPGSDFKMEGTCTLPRLQRKEQVHTRLTDATRGCTTEGSIEGNESLYKRPFHAKITKRKKHAINCLIRGLNPEEIPWARENCFHMHWPGSGMEIFQGRNPSGP